MGDKKTVAERVKDAIANLKRLAARMELLDKIEEHFEAYSSIDYNYYRHLKEELGLIED